MTFPKPKHDEIKNLNIINNNDALLEYFIN